MNERRLRDDPLPVVEGWDMHLYCRYTVGWKHDTDTQGVMFFGRSRAEARREATTLGWMFHRDGTTSCPSCVCAEGLR